MSVQNLWPLAFLILIPVIIFLYILKEKAKDETFSSTMLWQEIYKNLEAKTPFEKLKHNILMYLQILTMLLLIFALMAPVLKRGGHTTENAIIVVDNSASMQHIYDGDDTSLKTAIKEASAVIDGFSESATVTLISCGSEAKVIYQGSDKLTLKNRLKKMEPTNEVGDLNLASAMVQSLAGKLENVEIYCYTDTDFDVSSWTGKKKDQSIYVKNLYSAENNVSMDYVNYAVEDEGVNALCKITNYGKEEATEDVSLYAGSELLDVQNVTIPAGEDTVVYFETQEISTGVLNDALYPDNQNEKAVILKAELSRKDGLIADNVQSIVLENETEKRTLLLSKGNVFLEKALGLSDSVTVFKSDSADVLTQKEDSYDLYVFDSVEALLGATDTADSSNRKFDLSNFPEHASFLILDQTGFLDTDWIEKSGEQKDCVLHFAKHDYTTYLDNNSFGITKTNIYTLPNWAKPLVVTSDNQIAGYVGEIAGHQVAVLGFDIHNSDVALTTTFPILISQLTDGLLQVKDTTGLVDNFPSQAESNVTPVSESEQLGNMNQKKTGGRTIRNWLLLLAIAFLFIEWITYIKQVRTSKWKSFLAVRGLVLVLIICSIMGLSVTLPGRKAQTIFLMDVSDSMSGNVEDMTAYLKEVAHTMPEKNEMAIVAFGKDTAVDQFLSDDVSFSEFTTKPITVATNIQNAVETASYLFDEHVSKRLVLVTDGSENDGSMSLAASSLKAADVELITIPMEDSVGGQSEVYIDGLKTPSIIHVGDHYNVSVSVTSNVETDAVLTLYSGRITKGQQSVHVTKGNNQFVFEDVGEDGTIAQYKAVIEPSEDTIAKNNTYVSYAQIDAPPRVLLVEGSDGEASEFEKVLTAANVNYETVNPKGVPISVSQLNQYKAVITLDVYYDDLRAGFDNSLESFVKDFGGGYIAIGGENAYALGGYKNTPLEEILPVKMDLEGEKEIPKMAMTMVIDQSGSMTSPAQDNTSMTGLDLAKQAAIAGVEEIRPTDEIGVLAFDDKYHWTVPITGASDLDSIKDKISSIGYGGGTSIYPALNEAYQKIAKSDAKIKHIILLTDGQDEYRQYGPLLKQINDDGVTVSTVAVGKDSDTLTLQNIAEVCGGRYYYTDVNNSIPRIFAQEVYLSTNTYKVNEEFYPTVTSNNVILDGVTEGGVPAFLGYVATTAKPTADVLLTTHKEDPLLATWQCGLGRTVAFTSDGDMKWTADCANWENYPVLWSNIINYVITDTSFGEDSLEVTKSGAGAKIHYETKEYDKNTRITAVVTDDAGNSKEVTLDALKPGAFEIELAMDDVGIFSINLRKNSGTEKGSEIVKSYNTAFANQYSPEYQFSDSVDQLEAFVKQCDGQLLTLQDNIWKTKTKTQRTKKSLTILFLILAMLLFLVDIVMRRFSLDPFAGISKMVANAKQKWEMKKERKQAKKAGQRATALQSNSTQSTDKNDVSLTSDIHKDEVVKKAAENSKTATTGSDPGAKKTPKQDKKQKKVENAKVNQPEKLDMNQLLKKQQERK